MIIWLLSDGKAMTKPELIKELAGTVSKSFAYD